MRWRLAMMAALSWSGGALAADDAAARIVVTGSATVTTPPDIATIAFRLVGEGATSDQAVAAMVARQKAVMAGAGAPEPLRTSTVSIAAVRSAACRVDDDDGGPCLSTGPCAIVGYVATLAATLRTRVPGDAGTIVGLLGRLGAQNPRAEDFELTDPAAAERRAVAAALADGRAKAEAIAAATGVRLGRLLVASTEPRESSAQDIAVTGSRLAPPAVALRPIVVELMPQPIQTRAQVTVTYAIAP